MNEEGSHTSKQLINIKVINMLSMIPISNSQEWDKIVISFPEYDVYYLSSYVKAFQKHGDGEPYLVYFDNGKTRAINVVMKRDIAQNTLFKGKIELNSWFDLATPYGYGGFLIDGNDFDELDTAYTEYCRETNIVSEFVRFHPVLGNGLLVKRLYDVQKLGSTVYIDLTSPELIWENFTSRNRNQIRKAEKLGVEVYWGRSETLYRQFQTMYEDVMTHIGAESYYYFRTSFYDSILHDLKNNALVFYAVYQGNIISMAIIMFCNAKMHYHLSATDYYYRNTGATNLLLYEASLWGNANGYRTFHLGGGLGSAKDSLYKFKKAFNRSSEQAFCIGKKCFNHEMYNQLVQLRKTDKSFDENATFFPLYRS